MVDIGSIWLIGSIYSFFHSSYQKYLSLKKRKELLDVREVEIESRERQTQEKECSKAKRES